MKKQKTKQTQKRRSATRHSDNSLSNLERAFCRQRRPQRLVLAVEDYANHAVPLREVHRRRRVSKLYSDDARVNLGRRTEVVAIYLRFFL